MRTLSILPVLIALVSAATTPFKRDQGICLTELPCDTNWANVGLSVSIEGRELTNAQRLARGLPPKYPVRRWSADRRTEPAPSSLPNDPAPSNPVPSEPVPSEPVPSEPIPSDPVPSNPVPSNVPPTNYRGVIQVTNAANSAVIGYVSKNTLNGALYRYQPNLADALIVNFKVPVGQTQGSQLELTVENSDLTFPYLGLVQGRDNTNSDLATGSYHYVYLSGTEHSAPGAPPQQIANAYNSATGASRTAESSVWSFDSTTNALFPQWINTDGSAPSMQDFTQSTALYASGDAAAFNAKYPSPVTRLVYTFIPL